MASSNHKLSSDDPSPVTNDLSVVARPTTPLFSPNNYYYYFSPPPIYFIPDINRLPPPSIFVFYPLWFINPNLFESVQELHPLYSPNPREELSSPPTTIGSYEAFRRRSNKVTWRRWIKHEVESNGDHTTTVMLRNIPNKYTYANIYLHLISPF